MVTGSNSENLSPAPSIVHLKMASGLNHACFYPKGPKVIYYIFVNVCICTMGASTAGGIPAKLRGDAPWQRAGIHVYGFGGSTPGGPNAPWPLPCVQEKSLLN